MIYRKASPQPARLLLRVVATAGALAAAACSSSSSGGNNTNQDSGSEASPCGDGVCGSVANPDASGCNVGVCDAGGEPDGGDAGAPGCMGICGALDASTLDGPVGVVPTDGAAGAVDGGADH